MRFPLPGFLQRGSRSPGLPAPGLYPYTYEGEGERARIHLRIDPGGAGILLVNANRLLHLNPTAAVMTYLALEKTPAAEAASLLRRHYRVAPETARTDYQAIQAQIAELVRPSGACPICDLELEVKAPFSIQPSAPYRMDLALTYLCNNDCTHCYNDRARQGSELTTDEWRQVIDRVWAAGIPHVVFTGGEPTLRKDLPDLIAHAQRNGQIAGLNTNGRRLKDKAFVQALVDAGLDHVQITLESHDPAIHDRMVAHRGAWRETVAGLRQALDTPLYVMTNTTLLRHNGPGLAETLDFLAGLGVPTVGLNGLIYSGKGAGVNGLPEETLPGLLEIARDRTDNHGQRLIWYTPTQYCRFDPMQLELGVKGCTAALFSMCIEPDGSVLPCQSYYKTLGNILHEPWPTIWKHPLAVSLRERHNLPAKCAGCALVAECGGGCTLHP